MTYRNVICCTVCKREMRTIISGIKFSGAMEKVFGGPDDVRTIIFPNMVRTIRQGAFCGVDALRVAVLNGGLETLGTDEYAPDEKTYFGVFQESWLEKVKFPSTLKIIKDDAFMGCVNLKSVRLPEGLVEIGLRAFGKSGLESITTPLSMRTVHQSAFCECRNLRKAILNEGLEVLGTDGRAVNNEILYGAFAESSLEYIELPSTLKRIEYSTFEDCKGLKNINLPESLEYIGKCCFQKSALESIALPSALNAIERSTFYECKNLRNVVFPNVLEKIGLFAFCKTSLENIKLPTSLRKIA